eukprot:CAMPEP_0183513964 /NCGR_PEP_ID=MMETSP0371-20130417/12559_1 /TAXON_ID=268820 /ORGANISM="Peridinium aciculiferum, Strain PAER-2" /LENGTH=47 /DNA_ID= /DNA_START= /DNA_END= /DNA_ORIENTATION=
MPPRGGFPCPPRAQFAERMFVASSCSAVQCGAFGCAAPSEQYEFSRA